MSVDAMRMAGKELGRFLVRQGIKVGGKAGGKAVQEAGKVVGRAAVDAGVGLALEQGLPRAMGQEPTSSLGESVLRQGSAGLISRGVETGLTKTFPGAAGTNMGTKVIGTTGFIAGQVGGRRVTDAAFSGPRRVEMVEDTPTGATIASQEPESVDIIKPSTRDLSGVQAQEALSERDKYEYRLKMAQIEKMPSTVMHMSPDSNNQTLASLAQSMMRQASY